MPASPALQFIAGFANMRARNYCIPEVDKLQVGGRAGGWPLGWLLKGGWGGVWESSCL